MNKLIIVVAIVAFLLIGIGFLLNNENTNEKFQPTYAVYGEDTSSTIKILFKTTDEKEKPNSRIEIESEDIGGYASLHGLTELNIPSRRNGVYPLFISGNIDNFRTKIIIEDIGNNVNAFELELFNTPRTYKLYWNNEFIEEYTIQFTEHTEMIEHIITLENVNSINSLVIEEVI